MAQVQVQAVGRLHAACDECRTRKLKCSGGVPKCERCKREKIDCVYSPQKQMGRPRKRMRESEPVEAADMPVEAHIDHALHMNSFTDIPNFPYLDNFISTPTLQDAQSSNGSSAHGAVTPSQDDWSLSDPFGFSHFSNTAYATDPTIDPSLWNLQCDVQANNPNSSSQGNTGTCACLTTTWLTLTELQSIVAFPFPQVVIPLRKAQSALSDLIHCPECPKDSYSAIQNVQSIVSVMKAIVERFNKVLAEVDWEATRLEVAGQKKPFRIGDNNPALFHLHTDTPSCPMGFNVELEPQDWRKLVKTALRTEVHGGGSNPRPLLDLVKESETRQEMWHKDRYAWTEEMQQLHRGRQDCDPSQGCEALGAKHIRTTIENLNWD
ncbi:C6 finger domain [Pyrenophora seminiperda CCB06]|uniref:C6 finger domain n=1 Tax=Pyrenophora seminiperda CCB06 TaxID=1302712 RepID=A0A3M7M3R9_9PLEO|nr:C6 finger domain [Pyrenophora seminiperda CCB06]